jgi:vitamin B12 transporter
MVERVEVLFGGESLFYGTDALGGVINIVTKKPTTELSGQVNVKYGSYDLKDASFNISGGFGKEKENTILLFGHYEDYEGYQLVGDEVYLNNIGDITHVPRNSGYRRSNVGVKFFREFETARTSSIDFSFVRNDSDYNTPSPSYRYNDYLAFEHIAYLKWSHDVSEKYSYFIKAYFHNLWQRWTGQRPDYSYENYEDLYGFQDVGVNILNSYRFSQGTEVLFGLEYQNYGGQDDVMGIPFTQREEVWAVFVDVRPHFSFYPGWKTSFGGRYNKMVEESAAVWNVSSRLNFLNDSLYLAFNSGTAFKLPGGASLFSNPDNPHNSYTQGNPNLKPQSAKFLTASVGGDFSMGRFDITSFYYDTVDKISVVPGSSPTGGRMYQNVPGHTYDRGVTFSGAITPVDGLTFMGSYTIQNESQNGVEAKYPTWAKTYGNLSVSYETSLLGVPFGIGLYNTYTGKQYYNNMPSKEYGNYWNTDLSVFVKPKEKFTVQLQITNLFDSEEAYSMSRLRPAEGSPLLSVTEPDGYYYYDSRTSPFFATLSLTYDF